MGLCCFDVANVGGLGCEFLVLLGALGVSTEGRWFVYNDGMSRVDSCSGVESRALRGRLIRLPVCVVCVWWLRVVFVVRLVCRRFCCVTSTGGSIDLEYTLEDLGGRQIFIG